MSELRAHFLSLQLQQQQQQKHRSPAQSSTNLTAAITAVTITNLTHSGAVEIPKTEEQSGAANAAIGTQEQPCGLRATFSTMNYAPTCLPSFAASSCQLRPFFPHSRSDGNISTSIIMILNQHEVHKQQ